MEATPLHLKRELRILGIDDSPLLGKKVLVVGAVMRGGDWLEGVLRTHVTRDGLDATERLVEMVTRTRHYGQVRVVMLNGITMGGFNVVDVEELAAGAGTPVVSVMRRRPDMESIRSALSNLDEPDRRYRAMLKAGRAVEVPAARGGPVYVQYRGIDEASAVEIVRSSSTHSRIPEPVRIAHLIATGIVLGESRRRV